MKIAKLKLDLRAPDAERLHALASCSIAEMRDFLEGPCIASTVARAIAACSAEEHELAELAERVAAAGVQEIRARLRSLYAKAAPVVSAEAQKEAPDGPQDED